MFQFHQSCFGGCSCLAHTPNLGLLHASLDAQLVMTNLRGFGFSAQSRTASREVGETGGWWWLTNGNVVTVSSGLLTRCCLNRRLISLFFSSILLCTTGKNFYFINKVPNRKFIQESYENKI